MLAFTGMILQGGFLKLLGSMGKSDMEDYRRIFSLTLVVTFVVDSVFLAACLLGTNGLLQIAGAAYGYQTDRMICSVICVVVNVAASMVFINILPEAWRIAGLGIGSALATVAQMMTAWRNCSGFFALNY